jgi:putative membrane protein
MNKTRIVKGAVAGAIGGLAGTWAMHRFQTWWSRAADGTQRTTAAGRHGSRDWEELAVGSALGGVYGAFCEISPSTREMGGAAFGTTAWAAVGKAGMPMLGFEGPSTGQSPERRVDAIAAHAVYGVTTEIVRRGVRALLNGRRRR